MLMLRVVVVFSVVDDCCVSSSFLLLLFIMALKMILYRLQQHNRGADYDYCIMYLVM